MPTDLTVRLTDKTLLALDHLAERTDRSRDTLVDEAVQAYIALEAWQLERIERGLVAAELGAFVDDAEIDRIARKYGPSA